MNPFFEAMGWDVRNESGYSETYKDVVHEDAIKVGLAAKAPDYCFRIGGVRTFFVETNKPDGRTNLQRQVDATDQHIDQPVYELYDLAEEEIAIVEGKTGR